MEEIKMKGPIIPVKSNYDSKTSKANESNNNDSIKALEDEFDITSKTPKIKTISDKPKN